MSLTPPPPGPPGEASRERRTRRTGRPTRRMPTGPGHGKARLARTVSLVFLFGVAQVLFLFSHLFCLSDVVVRGNHRLTTQAILKQAGLPEGAYLWMLSPQRITQRLAGLREVRSASVSLALPGRVVLEVRERQAVALVSQAGSNGPWFEVDAEGVILGPEGASRDLPRVKLEVLAPGQARVEPTPLLLVLRARSWVEPSLPGPAEAYQVDATLNLSVETHLLRTPVVIRLGTLESMEYKMHVLRALAERLKSEARPALVIDLRFPSPVVRPLKPEPMPSPTP